VRIGGLLWLDLSPDDKTFMSDVLKENRWVGETQRSREGDRTFVPPVIICDFTNRYTFSLYKMFDSVLPEEKWESSGK